MVVKYGIVAGPTIIREYEIATGEVFKHLSGCFVELGSSNTLEIAAAATTDIIGWALTGDYTSVAGNKCPVNICRETLYRLPVATGTTLTAQTRAELKAHLGESCDVSVGSNIMYADFAGSSNSDILQVVDYEYWGSAAGQQSLIVRLNTTTLTVKGVIAA